MDPIIAIAMKVATQLDIGWTFLLLITRATALMLALPGIGGGERGLAVRMPAILCLAMVSVPNTPPAIIPTDWSLCFSQVFAEMALGFLLGLVPYMLIAAAQTSGQLITTAMGMNAGNMIDPTLGVQTSDISIIIGNLCVVLFLILNGHHVVILAMSGLNETVAPGTFLITGESIEILIQQSSAVLRSGLMLAAPIMVALLLTNVLLGMISKAVPTVNVFMVSYPLSTGIGMLLLVAALPDMMVFMQKELSGLEGLLTRVLTAHHP